MKISYYELLKMMKEGNAPKKVKYMQMIFLGNNENYDFEDDNGEIHFLSDYLTMDEMYKYDEIEILDDEDEEKELPEKIKSNGRDFYSDYTDSWIDKEETSAYCEYLMNKYNDLIDYLEKQKKGE